MAEYTIEKVEHNYDKNDLLNMGIVFVSPEETIKSGKDKLKEEYKYAKLTPKDIVTEKMSELKDSTVAVYKKGLDPQFIRDVWGNKNFYTMKLKLNNATVEELNNVYLRKDYLEEDIAFYVNYKFTNKSREENSVANLTDTVYFE